MSAFTKESLADLKPGDKFTSHSLLPGMDPDMKIVWELIHGNQKGDTYYFDLHVLEDIMITSVEVKFTPRGITVEEME